MNITDSLQFEQVTEPEFIPVDLLLLADPAIEQINSYLAAGKCYVCKLNAGVVGVIVLSELNADTVEIKNIAISNLYQGKGLGKALLKFAEEISRESGYKKLLIGTGNSSIGQLALYQKQGFEIVGIEMGYFTKNYSEPIIENGIACKHMILLEKALQI